MLKNNTNARYVVNYANKYDDGTWLFETMGVFDNLELAQSFLAFKFDEVLKTETVLEYDKEEDEKWGLYRITGSADHKLNSLRRKFEMFLQST